MGDDSNSNTLDYEETSHVTMVTDERSVTWNSREPIVTTNMSSMVESHKIATIQIRKEGSNEPLYIFSKEVDLSTMEQEVSNFSFGSTFTLDLESQNSVRVSIDLKYDEPKKQANEVSVKSGVFQKVSEDENFERIWGPIAVTTIPDKMADDVYSALHRLGQYICIIRSWCRRVDSVIDLHTTGPRFKACWVRYIFYQASD